MAWFGPPQQRGVIKTSLRHRVSSSRACRDIGGRQFGDLVRGDGALRGQRAGGAPVFARGNILALLVVRKIEKKARGLQGGRRVLRRSNVGGYVITTTSPPTTATTANTAAATDTPNYT